jgi:hypothetical protein
MHSPVQNVVGFPTPDEAQTQALAIDIQAQLANLPVAIVDDATYRRAKESLPLLKRAEDKVVDFFKDIKASASRAHRAICSKENEQLLPIKGARQRVSSLIYSYEQEQERLRRERELKAQEDERRRREETALAEAEAMSVHSPELAEQILEQELAAPAPIVSLPSSRADVAGVSTRENWQFVFVGGSPGQKWKDLDDATRKRVMALLPREYLIPDEAAIGKVVKALKSGTKIPGIQAYDAGTIAVRG